MSRGPSEFLPLAEAAVLAAWGPNGRHAALLEDAFDVLMETPGGGVALSGKVDARRRAKQAIELLARRAGEGLEVAQADVRVAIDQAARGVGGSGPLGRRGAVAAKTPAQARYLDCMAAHELVFALGPAGTGKTFLAVAHGAGLLISGEVGKLVITRPAVEAGERLGFLPGDLLEKVDPYMAPIFEALGDILG
ncbi:MAG: PhoH family protein, partial [Caulobacteraceae bacterium]